MNLNYGGTGDTLTESLEIPAALYECTDYGNGQRLIRKYGDNIRYCTTFKSWFIWDNEVWKKDCNLEIERLADDIVQSINQEADSCKDPITQTELQKWAKKSGGLSHRTDLITSARPYVAITSEQWDADTNLFNCENGTLELDTLTFRKHRREDYLTKVARVKYDPDADCPIWEAHLSFIFNGNEEMIDAFQMWSGYCLLPDNREQIIFIPYGSGMNGKSATLNTMAHIFGNYARSIDPNTLMASKRSSGGSPRPDIVRLDGVRLITCIEGDEGDRLSEKLIKQITGGDTVVARTLFQEEREFKVGAKIWFATNHKPEIRGNDHAIWRRIRMIPFDVTIPMDKRDLKIEEKLQAEGSGILNWMIEGLKAFYKNGSQLVFPSKVQLATEEYRIESDIIGSFIGDCCIIDTDAKEYRSNILAAYYDWCKENGETPVSSKEFARELKERGVWAYDKGRRRWGGIRVKTESDDVPLVDLNDEPFISCADE